MRRILILLAVLAGSACERTPDPVAPETGHSRPSFSAAMGEVANDPTPEQAAVAQVVPGFGGYFIDGAGRPTVYLTDAAQRPAAEQALAGFLASFGWSAKDLQVRPAEYSHAQLDAWYRQAWPLALAIPGALSSDLDEARNRLRFTGIDVAAVSNIASTLANLGVPTAAAVVELSGPVLQMASLRDKIRPPHGGLQIQFFASPVSPLVSVCTLGFNAVKDGVNSFVTNSHCSNVQGGTELRTDYYQSTRGGVIPNPDNFIGFEVDDPLYARGGECPLGRECRYSDAARAQYGAGQTFVLGRIARTAVLNTERLQDDAAMLEIHATTPTYRLVAEQAIPVQGQVLNKVGRTTGWTRGPVIATCENINVSGSTITQLCQSRVGAHVAGGDSGSPVFGENTDGTVFLAGILWGSSTNLTTGEVQFLFSPLASVERELGELTTTDPLGGKKPKKRIK